MKQDQSNPHAQSAETHLDPNAERIKGYASETDAYQHIEDATSDRQDDGPDDDA